MYMTLLWGVFGVSHNITCLWNFIHSVDYDTPTYLAPLPPNPPHPPRKCLPHAVQTVNPCPHLPIQEIQRSQPKIPMRQSICNRLFPLQQAIHNCDDGLVDVQRCQ